jgi:hypothetical protein
MFCKLIIVTTVALAITEQYCYCEPIYAWQPSVMQTPLRTDLHRRYQNNPLDDTPHATGQISHRRRYLLTMATSLLTNGWVMTQLQQQSAHAVGEFSDKFNVDSFLKSTTVVSPMGFAGQAGKNETRM